MSGAYGTFTVDNTIIHQKSYIDFLRTDIMLADLNTWAIRIVGSYTFAIKYFIGRARPEVGPKFDQKKCHPYFYHCYCNNNNNMIAPCTGTVFIFFNQEVIWAIKNNSLRFGVPLDVKNSIRELTIRKPEEFTAYKEGSPKHPSWPAMHASASCCCFWMAVVLNLTKEQMCQARLTDYAVSYARTVAGVHFSDDNIAGLNLGQELIAHFLPNYLHDVYGADIAVVKEKINTLRYDWNKFDPLDPCPERGIQ